MNIDFKHIAIIASLALPLAACSQESSNASGGSKSVTDAAKDMGGKLADTAKQYSGQFEEMRRMADGKLSGVDTTIADLKTKADAKGGEVKTQIEGLITQIKAKKDEIAKTFSNFDMKSIDMKSFDGLEAKVEPMLAELQKLLEKAKSM